MNLGPDIINQWLVQKVSNFIEEASRLPTSDWYIDEESFFPEYFNGEEFSLDFNLRHSDKPGFMVMLRISLLDGSVNSNAGGIFMDYDKDVDQGVLCDDPVVGSIIYEFLSSLWSNVKEAQVTKSAKLPPNPGEI